ncbi:MAG: twin-arginine translocase subunit TatC [Candidatus Latescibacteria bacterium]|nr:twin-arginine translocase subunit TatC [Candidatus Latescibacterota bacterium]
MDPYTGYEDYDPELGYPDTSGGTYDSGNKTSAPTEPEEEAIPQIAVFALNPHRRLELDLLDDSFPASDNSIPYTGYGKIPLTAVFSDNRRVSVHPLGVVVKPPGIAEIDWTRMDADNLFPAAYDPTLIEEEKLPYAKTIETEETPQVPVSSGSDGESESLDEEESNDPSEMPFLDHLEEFRWALLKSIMIVAVCMIGSWFLSDMFYSTITRLANQAELPLIYTKIMEPIMIKLEMALFMGMVISLPFIFYFLWSFISPGLFFNEKRVVLPLVYGATICFFIGASIAYFIIIPITLSFIKKFMFPDVEPLITIGSFIGTSLKFTVLFGVLFELPLVSFVLAKIGILKHTWMSKYRKYAIIVIFIIGAFLTPPDPGTMIMMALPLMLLYEISILIARFAGRNTLI